MMKKLIVLTVVIAVAATSCVLARPLPNPPTLRVHKVLQAECAIENFTTREYCTFYPNQKIGARTIVWGWHQWAGKPGQPKLMTYVDTQGRDFHCPNCVVITGTNGGTFQPGWQDTRPSFHPYLVSRVVDSAGRYLVSWPFFQDIRYDFVFGCLSRELCDIMTAPA